MVHMWLRRGSAEQRRAIAMPFTLLSAVGHPHLSGPRIAPPTPLDVPRKSKAILSDTTGASRKDILELTEKLNVSFMRLQFTDILGVNKNVEIPASQFEKAFDGDMMFDGSSIEGFVRVEESDMLLK